MFCKRLMGGCIVSTEKDMKKADISDLELEGQSKALKEAMSFTIGKGLPLPKNWSGEDLSKLEFPNDLSKLSIDQLGELMGIWSSVMAYVQYEVARTDITKTALGNRYEFERKKLYLKLLKEDMTEEQRKAEVLVRAVKLQEEFEIAKAKYTMMRALLSAYSKYFQALSRELSRRGIVDPTENEPTFRQEKAKTRKSIMASMKEEDHLEGGVDDEFDFEEDGE